MEHSRTFYALSVGLCPRVLLAGSENREMWSCGRPLRLPWRWTVVSRLPNTSLMMGKLNSQILGWFLFEWEVDIWTTLCRVIRKFYTCFATNFMQGKWVQKWLCRRRKANGMDEILLGDVHEGTLKQVFFRNTEANGMDKILLGDVHAGTLEQVLWGGHPKMQTLTSIGLCKIHRFWLHYTAPNGIILRAIWQAMQGHPDRRQEGRKSTSRSRNDSYECVLGQNQRELWRNCPINTQKRPFHFCYFLHVDYVMQESVAHDVDRIMT